MGRFVWKVFGGTVVLIVLTALVLDVLVVRTLGDHAIAELDARVGYEANLARELVDAVLSPDGTLDVAPLARAAAGLQERLTVIAHDGRVLFDSHEDPAVMDDHSRRPEVLAPGTTVRRRSATLGREMTYRALPIDRAGEPVAYARVAVSTAIVEERIAAAEDAIRGGAALAVVAGLVLAFLFARRVTRPISRIAGFMHELEADAAPAPLPEAGRDELGDLARAVNTMAERLRERFERIERARFERDAIFSAMSEGIVAVDAERRVVFVSPAVETLLGARTVELGGPLHDLTRVHEVVETVDECLGRGARVGGEATVDTRDGERQVELEATPFGKRDAHDGRRGCVLVLRDVTGLRRLEVVRRDFVSNVSHELKTPLTAMRGYLDAVLDHGELEPERRRDFLAKARRNTDRLTAIVGDLLSLSRLESDEAGMDFAVLPLASVAEDVLRAARLSADEKRIRLALEHDPAEPVRVRADRTSLTMAISNLLDNAIKYSPDGRPVTIRVRAEDRRAVLEVADRGPGIPAADRERVFERFYRVDKARSRALGGTGLGLSIVRHVVSAHGGCVAVESAVGEGSTFRIELPLSEASA